MRESANPAPPAERRATGLPWGLILLGLMLAANAVDLLSRYAGPSTGRTPFETFLLLLQTGVCAALVLVMVLATFFLGVRAEARPARARRHGLARPQPAELN